MINLFIPVSMLAAFNIAALFSKDTLKNYTFSDV